MAKPTKRKIVRNNNAGEILRAGNVHETLAQFEEFQAEILPALRNDMSSGMTAEELYKKYQALAAARGISIALGEANSATALSAVREILDRTQGKATENKQVEHKFSKMKDEEIDAVLITQLDELESGEAEDE